VAVSEFAVAMENRVEPIYVADVLRAGAFAEQLQGLSSRDLIHLAVMERIGADTIITADRAFDVAPGITRLDPAALPGWRATVEA
jgi:predicted nucleic acid-binding protein